MFSRLERVLEGMVEGVFSRAFKAQLQPIEVARRLTRAMEDQRAVSVSATYVPNAYTVHLAPETYASFQAISARLLIELEQYLRDSVEEHDYQLVGPIAVRLLEDPDVKPGELTIDAVNDATAVPSTPPAAPPPAPVLRSYPTAAPTPAYGQASDLEHTALIATRKPADALEVVSGEGCGNTVTLADGLTIGRSPDSALVIAEPGVSRQHAVIVREGEEWRVRDLGSTNGTYLNSRRITNEPLHVGDLLKIGQTTLQAK